jgi:hypothetical protein
MVSIEQQDKDCESIAKEGGGMSMARCDGCDRIIDTDNDLNCYRDKGNPRKPWGNYLNDNICLCEWCRDEREIWDE